MQCKWPLQATKPASFRFVKWPPRERLLIYLLWAVCGCAVAGALAAVALPLGGAVNRIAGVAIPFGIAAAAAAALALSPSLERWLSLVLYGLAALALTYSLMSLASLPLRLTVLGTCPPSPSACPTGFEPAITGGEMLGVEAGIVLGLVGLLIAVAAMEVRYRPRLRIIGRAPIPSEAPAPPPEMMPSAIVKKPVAGDKQP
jgi:hypothetical protein